MFERVLTGSRYMVLVGVVGSLIAALVLLLYGALEVVYILIDTSREISIDGEVDKTVILTFIQVVDLFLLGTAFYIISLGLYELFIDDRLNLPPWLAIHNFDDLKSKLINVVVVVLGVLFLGQAALWKGGSDLLFYGASIALVIASLSYFLSNKSKKSGKPMPPGEEEH